jgi:hypothetical protein
MDSNFSELAHALTSAGFSEAQSIQALAATGGNIEAAMNW